MSLPTPVDQESRICFGIVWLATEADARVWDQHVRDTGQTYNGGFFHGMSCGRDSGFDRKNPDGTVTGYAVTTA
jgi:hypothetical protein